MRIDSQNSVTAEQVAQHLDKPRRISPGRWLACCPAHPDQSPSLQISDGRDRLLLKCWGGCDYAEIRDALRRIGALPHWEPNSTERTTGPAAAEVARYIREHEDQIRNGVAVSEDAQRRYRSYQRIHYRPFAPGEVAEMHYFCLAYREAVKNGQDLTEAEHSTFTSFSKIVRDKGVPYAW